MRTMEKMPKARAVMADDVGIGKLVPVTAVAIAFHVATEGTPN